MPRRLATDPRLDALIRSQDWVVSARQALDAGVTRGALDRRLQDGRWRRLLPGVYLCAPCDATRRQQLIATQLWAGPQSAIDADDACAFHGVRAVVPDERLLRVVVPEGSSARSRGFVVVRRSSAPLPAVATDRLRYLAAPEAVIAAARLRSDSRRVLAILSDAVQRRIVTADQLFRAHMRASPRNAAAADAALRHLRVGVRSAPEGSFRLLAQASQVLPPLLYNPLLRLPCGRMVSPDTLAPDAALVHETNGRSAHARADLFEDMQERHDAMTAAGLTVLHNSPARILRHGREVIAQVEQCYLRLAGRGLPAGVRLLGSAA